MRPRRLQRMLVLAFLGAVTAGAVTGTAVAKADPIDEYTIVNAPIVCALLDEYPSVAGVEGVATALIDKGLAPKDAGEVLVRSVVGWCPRHTPEVNGFIAKWAPRQAI